MNNLEIIQDEIASVYEHCEELPKDKEDGGKLWRMYQYPRTSKEGKTKVAFNSLQKATHRLHTCRTGWNTSLFIYEEVCAKWHSCHISYRIHSFPIFSSITIWKDGLTFEKYFKYIYLHKFYPTAKESEKGGLPWTRKEKIQQIKLMQNEKALRSQKRDLKKSNCKSKKKIRRNPLTLSLRKNWKKIYGRRYHSLI